MTHADNMALVSIAVEPVYEDADETITRYTFPITQELADAVFEFVAGEIPDNPPPVAAESDYCEGEFAYTSIYDHRKYIGGVIAYLESDVEGWQLAVSIPNTPEGEDQWDQDHIDWRQPGPSHWMLILGILKRLAPIEVIRNGLRKPY